MNKVNFRPTERKQVSIFSRAGMAAQLEEDSLMAWSGLNIGNSIVMLGNFYLEGAISHLKSYYSKDDKLQSVEHWTKALNKNIDTLNIYMSDFFKSKKTQWNHTGGLIDLFQDVIERIVKVTAGCEPLCDARLTTEVIIAPTEQHRNLKKQKGVIFYNDLIKEMIEGQNREMLKEGLKPNENHEILDRLKAEAANEAQNVKLRQLRSIIEELEKDTKLKTKKAAFNQVIETIDILI